MTTPDAQQTVHLDAATHNYPNSNMINIGKGEWNVDQGGWYKGGCGNGISYGKGWGCMLKGNIQRNHAEGADLERGSSGAGSWNLF